MIRRQVIEHHLFLLIDRLLLLRHLDLFQL